MKKFKIIVLFAIMAFFCLECGQKTNLIIGTWKFSEMATTGDIPADLKEKMKENLDEMKKTYLLVIKPDSTFERSLSESTSPGKWTLSPDSRTLTLTYEDGGKEISDILELTEKKMVTSVNINDYKNTITFEKQEEKK